MFLKELSKDESICFLNLVSIFAKVDNEFAKEEKVLLDEYKEELGLINKEVEVIEYNEIIEILKSSSKKSKIIIYFELVGLALVDGNYENQEIDFLDKVAAELEISRSKKIEIANFFYNFTNVYNFTTVNADNNIKLLKEEAEVIIN